MTCILTGCCGSQERVVSESIEFSSSPGIIKAMSFNIRVDTILDGMNRWDCRKQLVFDVLTDHAADVIGVQEALDHQIRQIQQALPQYNHYAVGRNDGKLRGESCVIFYRKDRFDLRGCGTFWFSGTPAKPGSKDWGNVWPRICSWIYLTEKTTGTSFYVYNLHLAVFSQNARQKSSELLAKRIAARNNPDPFIVMGDFNMKLDNPTMEYLQNNNTETSSPGMLSAWLSVHLNRTSGAKIDHILISDDSQALDAKIDSRRFRGRYPSDHFPIIATIRIPSLP